MGKTAIKKSLAKCIGNVVLHEILLKYTNRPESTKHLKDEISDYSSDAFEKAQLHSWNDIDKEEIKSKSITRVKNLIRNYPDIEQKYDEKEIENLVNETIKRMLS